MYRRRTIFLIILMLIITVFPFNGIYKQIKAASPPPNDGIDGLQFIEGDWIVSNTQSYTNETIVLTGNLTITSTGNLTFHNVTLKMNCTENGTYHIEVKSGGEFYIYDNDDDSTTTYDASNITSNIPDGEHRFLFWVRQNSNFTMKNSELHECGYFWGGNREKEGLLIETDNAVIDHSLISNNYNGIQPSQSSPTITNNNISWNDGSGVMCRYWANATIKDNLLESNVVYGICCYGESNTNPKPCNGTIQGNRIKNTSRGEPGGVGISLPFGSSPIIKDNIISGSGEDQIYVESGGTKLEWDKISIVNTTMNGGNYGIATSSVNYLEIINSSITNAASSDMSLTKNTFIALNTTFNKSRVWCAYDYTRFYVKWYLHVYVNDTNNNPISNANVVVKNQTNSIIFDGYTNPNGYVKWINTTEYVQNSTTKTFHTPHNITVTKNGYETGYADIDMNESKTAVITLQSLPVDVELDAGWNSISLVGDEDGNPDTDTNYKCTDLAQSIETSGSDVYQIARFTPMGWDAFVYRNAETGNLVIGPGQGINNFKLNNSESYMLFINKSATWDFPWPPFVEQPDWYITGGWNGINCARVTETTSNDLLTNYPYINSVANFTSGGFWETDPSGNFYLTWGGGGMNYTQIQNANGIFVRSSDYGVVRYEDGSSHDYNP